jgi:hypothetical protein
MPSKATADKRSLIKINRLLKNHSESFDGLRTNGMGTELTAENPFMLSVSKHVPLFFNSLLNIEL